MVKWRVKSLWNQSSWLLLTHTISWVRVPPLAQSLAQANENYPRDIICLSGHLGYHLTRVFRPQTMLKTQEEIPVEKSSDRGSTGIAAAQKYDAAQIDKL